jgi:hypothetical protein
MDDPTTINYQSRTHLTPFSTATHPFSTNQTETRNGKVSTKQTNKKVSLNYNSTCFRKPQISKDFKAKSIYNVRLIIFN